MGSEGVRARERGERERERERVYEKGERKRERVRVREREGKRERGRISSNLVFKGWSSISNTAISWLICRSQRFIIRR